MDMSSRLNGFRLREVTGVTSCCLVLLLPLPSLPAGSMSSIGRQVGRVLRRSVKVAVQHSLLVLGKTPAFDWPRRFELSWLPCEPRESTFSFLRLDSVVLSPSSFLVLCCLAFSAKRSSFSPLTARCFCSTLSGCFLFLQVFARISLITQPSHLTLSTPPRVVALSLSLPCTSSKSFAHTDSQTC